MPSSISPKAIASRTQTPPTLVQGSASLARSRLDLQVTIPSAHLPCPRYPVLTTATSFSANEVAHHFTDWDETGGRHPRDAGKEGQVFSLPCLDTREFPRFRVTRCAQATS